MLRQLAVVAAIATSPALAQTLEVGMDAPTLEGVEWLKKGPHDSWEAGHVYVLDFWAPWCGPCVKGIPHMTEVQDKYEEMGENVHVIGVSIWPDPNMQPTGEFVEEWGDRMDYAVANDVASKAAIRFMSAADQNGIPTVMIVDQQGKLAWIGHPMSMDNVLASVVDGTYDLSAVAELNDLWRQVNEAANAKEWEQAVSLMDEMMARSNSELRTAGHDPYYLVFTQVQVYFAYLNDPDRAYAALRGAIDNRFWEDARHLNEIAWFIAEAPIEPRDLGLAKRAAERANELASGKDASIVDTLARIAYRNGDLDKAIELEEKAVELASDPETKAEFEESLKEYRDERAAGG